MSLFLEALLERRQSPENPTTSLSNPASWFFDAVGLGEKVWSGAKVSPRTALNFTAYFACVRVLSETLATVPLKVYRRLPAGGREEARDHPVWALVHDRPNPWMTSFALRELAQQHLVTWGNAYIEVVRDNAGRLVELFPLRPDRTRVELVKVAGESTKILITDIVKEDGGTEKALLAEGDYIHVPGLGFDGLKGYSPITLHRQAIGLGRATEEYGGRFFGSGGKQQLLLKHPANLGDPETLDRVRKKYGAAHNSLSDSHKMMIIDEGMEAMTIGIPGKDSQFLETRKFQVEEMARIHRIPPHKIQHLERATFSNIEHQAIEFVQDVAMPMAVRWEQVLNWELFRDEEREDFFVEFSLDGLLRGDTKSRAEALQIKRMSGVINADEWRKMDNLGPQPNGQGQTYLVPLNMAPADSLGNLDAVRHVLRRAAEHICRREGRAGEKALSKLDTGGPGDVVPALASFYESFAEAIAREFTPVADTMASLVGGAVSSEVEAYVEDFARRHREESRRLLLEALSGGGVDAAKLLFEDWCSQRASRVTQEETQRLLGLASRIQQRRRADAST